MRGSSNPAQEKALILVSVLVEGRAVWDAEPRWPTPVGASRGAAATLR